MIWLIGYATIGLLTAIVLATLWADEDGVGVCFVHAFMGLCAGLIWPLTLAAAVIWVGAALVGDCFEDSATTRRDAMAAAWVAGHGSPHGSLNPYWRGWDDLPPDQRPSVD